MAFTAEDIHPRHRIFADEWLTGEHTGKPFNGRAAHEYAGYKVDNANPSANASKLLRHPKVAVYIRSRLDELGMSAAEVLMRFAKVARSEMGDIIVKSPDGGKLLLDVDKVLENKALISKFGYDSNGNPKIEFHDSQRALEQVARVLGMFKDGLELSGPGGVPVVMKVEFIDADGTGLDLGPEGVQEDEEDFSDVEAQDAFLDQLD